MSGRLSILKPEDIGVMNVERLHISRGQNTLLQRIVEFVYLVNLVNLSMKDFLTQQGAKHFTMTRTPVNFWAVFTQTKRGEPEAGTFTHPLALASGAAPIWLFNSAGAQPDPWDVAQPKQTSKYQPFRWNRPLPAVIEFPLRGTEKPMKIERWRCIAEEIQVHYLSETRVVLKHAFTFQQEKVSNLGFSFL